MVDDGWKLVEVELETVSVNGNGHDEEADEPQQTLFSWAEFMAEEPIKPRRRKAQAPSLSLFEWAVGAGAGGRAGRRGTLGRCARRGRTLNPSVLPCTSTYVAFLAFQQV